MSFKYMKEIFASFLISLNFFSMFGILQQPLTSTAAASVLPVHNLNTGLNYATIQGAINAPETLNGHTIEADAGIYYEDVVLNKTISLMGENATATIIDGSETGNTVTISASSRKPPFFLDFLIQIFSKIVS